LEFKLPFTGIMEHLNCGYILVLSVFTEIALQSSNEIALQSSNEIALQSSNEMMVTRRDFII
jgi:hypothetical protein